MIGLTLLMTSFYMVMLVGNISFLRHALLGSICVAVLWEITRHVLVWYFSTLSMVNIIYGSLTTAILALLRSGSRRDYFVVWGAGDCRI
ncbi:MAG: hypothetical protein R3E89_11185 [Thiolinea sp.]